jgi:hypothetical protein
MKRRITLTIDPGVARRAKRLAHERRTSVSALVEDLVRSATLASGEEPRSFVDKWAGRFTVRQRTRPDPRLDALKARYRLDAE